MSNRDRKEAKTMRNYIKQQIDSNKLFATDVTTSN